jgi:beta-glucanase (GH16 family)
MHASKTLHPAACLATALLFLSLKLSLPGQEAAGPEKVLEFSAMEPGCAQVSAMESPDPADPGIAVTIQPGPEGYPGLELKPKGGDSWDLSAFGHIEAVVVNTGQEAVSVSLRADNKGDWKDNPWNTESANLKPGETKTIRIIFGYAYGHKPSYKLDSAAVSQLLVFSTKTSKERSFRLASIKAGGLPGETPPVDPKSVRVKPQDGFLLGGGVAVDVDKQVAKKEGAEASAGPGGQSLQVAFSKKGQAATFKPALGKWDLREGNQVRVKIKNIGSQPATPFVRADSQQGSTAKASSGQPLAPGASAEVAVSFIPAVPWTGIKDSAKTEWNPTQGTGTKFTSDAVDGITLMADEAGGEQKFEVESVKLAAPPADLPDWLGKRPPVEGDWTQTFTEEFDGTAVNLKKWNVYTANYWDKASHFSKDNVLVEKGTAILRYEKKTGRHNDNPEGKETPYATGFLDTYGKWVQRYGYFEARMKLPKAPGLWPAMWLMPDRGLAEGPQWKRADTGRGGMEFDIMEFLSRWGVYRFNIAFHWDGYGKEHKQTGSQGIYVEHDKDGYITTGLLWLPGEATMYNNGKVIARWESPRISNIPSDVMFTHVMGGWDNNSLDDAQLPDDFIIDYVRCWQRKDLASEADGVKSTQETPAAPTTPDS